MSFLRGWIGRGAQEEEQEEEYEDDKPQMSQKKKQQQQQQRPVAGQVAQGRVIASGDVKLLHLEDGSFQTLIESGALMQLVELPPFGRFQFSLRVIFLNEVHMEMLLTPTTRITYTRDGRLLEWVVVLDGRSDVWRAEFQPPEAGLTLCQQVVAKLVEVKRQEEFRKIVSSELDEQFVYDGFADDNMTDDDSSDGESKDPEDDFDYGSEDEEDDEDRAGSVRASASPPRSARKQARAAENAALLGGMAKNRTFTIAVDKKSNRAAIDVLKHDEYDRLQYVATIEKLQDKEGNWLTPTKSMLHQQDERMLLLSSKRPGKVSVLDLNRGAVVDEYDSSIRVGGESIDNPIRNFGPVSKYAGLTGESTFQAVSSNRIFRMDPRVQSQSKFVADSGYDYKTNPKLACLAVNSEGQMVVASDKGEIRLYSDTRKRAKNLFPGVGDPIVHIEASNDGEYVLATTRQYLLLLPMRIPDDAKGRTAFDVGMGKAKPEPIKLQLAASDLVKYGIQEVDFKEAHFEIGQNTEEESIVSATGNFLIVWSIKGVVQKRNRYSYKIRDMGSQVVAGTFRYNRGDQLLAATGSDVMSQTRKKKK